MSENFFIEQAESLHVRYRSGEAGVNWEPYLKDQRERMAGNGILQQGFSEISSREMYGILLQYGEPSYQEVFTSSFLAELLLDLGYKMSSDSGCVQNETHLIFSDPRSCILTIRCDMDAVSCSSHQYLHNCGHAINMVSAFELAKSIPLECRQKIAFIFQPAEEGAGNIHDGYIHPQKYGGGQYLRNKGIYDGVQNLISYHIDTSLPSHSVRITSGEATAAAYRFDYHKKGKVAHAALPWQGENPLYSGANFILDTQKFNQAMLDLEEGYALISPSNIVCGQNELNSLPPDIIISGISRIVGQQALEKSTQFMESYGVLLELEAPPVMNSPKLAQLVKTVAEDLNLEVKTDPAKFRDETAWAGKFELPWADPLKYPGGAERILHFFTSGGDACGGLHSNEFNPDLVLSVNLQVMMLRGIVSKFLDRVL